MMETILPPYVFRGTTIGFQGNETSNRIPVTCTTANPCKALLFALSAAYEYKTKGTIYIAETCYLRTLKILQGNCFEDYEEEIGFSVSPGRFQEMCIANVSTEVMQAVLNAAKIHYNLLVNPQTLSSSLTQIGNISMSEIAQLVESIQKLIKNG